MICLILLIMMLLPSSLFCAAYDEIIENALSYSIDSESAELARAAGLIAIEQAELEDKTDYSFSVSLSPLEDDSEIMSVSTFSASITLPDDDTTVTASLPFYVRYDGRGALLSPSASVEHVFDWGRDDDYLEELQIAASKLSVEREYDSAYLSIKESVLSLIVSLLQNERSIMEEEEELRDIERDISTSLELSIFSEDSLSYQELLLERNRSEELLRIARREKEELEARFLTFTGVDWDGVESIPMPVFPDIYSYTSSSLVSSAELQTRIAEEEYLLEESEQNPRKLTVGGGAGGRIRVSDGLLSSTSSYIDDDNAINVTGSIGWESRNWTLSLAGGGEWDSNYRFTPTMTIMGSWSSDSTSESDKLKLLLLRNEVLQRTNEYNDALRTFEEDKESIWSQILSWRREMEETEAEISYNTALLDMTRIRFDRGLSSEEDVHDREIELSLLLLDRDILLLEGLIVQTEAEMLVL